MEIPAAVRRLAGTAALVCVALAGFALAAWFLGAWRIATFGPDYVPMARITALLLLVLGSALAWRCLRPTARGGRPATLAGAALGATVAGLELVRSAADFGLPWDRWNSGGQAALGEIPLDRMSPLAAVTLCLTAGAVILAETPLARRACACGAAGAAAGTALLISVVVILGYASGTPIGYVGSGSPMALLTAFAFVALNAAVLLVCGQIHPGPAGIPGGDAIQRKDHRFSRALVGGTIAALTLLAIVGVVYLRLQHTEARKAAFLQLDAITRLKTEQIAQWRDERLDDARFLLRTPAVGRDITSFLANPADPAARAAVTGWLEGLRNRRVPYAAALLFDAGGNLRLAVPASAGAEGAGTDPDFARALAGRDALLGDLRRSDPAGPARLDILVPFPGAGPGAIVVLRIDPVSAFFPLLLDHPLSEAPGEFVLLRREGNDLLQLSEVPGRPGSALTMRRPVSQPDLIGSALARGEPGHFDGRNENGIPVFASFRRVPDSPWTFGARVTQAAAFASQKKELWTTSLLVGVLLGATLLGAGFISRQRRAGILQQALRSEQERDSLARRLALVTRHANDAMLIFDEEMRIVDANERALATYGYTAEEIRRLHARDLRAPGTADRTATDFAAALRTDGLIFETVHRRRDGSTFPVETSTRSTELEGHRHVLSIIRDISERQAHAQEVERLNRLYLVLSRINSALVHAETRDELFRQVCSILVETGGFKLAWVGWLDPASHRIVPIAIAGDEHGYVVQIKISADPTLPEGQGPSGAALRENRTHVSNDFMADPATAAWHEAAARSGIAASIALPLSRGGQVEGTLTVYAGERNYFQSRELELLEEAARDLSFGLEVFAERARRAEAEAALAAREEVISTIFSQALDGIVLIDPATRGFSEFNAAAHATLGYTREEFARLHLDDIERGHNDEAIRATFERMRREGGQSFDTRFRTRTGAMRDVHVSALMVTIRGKEYVSAVWADITERKRMETALAANKARLQFLLSETPAMIYALRAGGDYATTFLSDNVKTVLGYDPTDFTTDPGFWFAHVHAEDRARAAADFQRIAAGAVLVREYRYLHRDGRIRWMRDETRVVRDPEGRPQELVGCWLDITELKQAELALRESEERYRIIAENTGDVIWLADLRTQRFTYVSPAVRQVHGFTPEELVGRPLAEMLPPGMQEFIRTEIPVQIANFATGGNRARHRTDEVDARHKDGRLIRIEVATTIMAGPDGKAAILLGVTRDITERRQAEAKLRESESRFRALFETSVDGILVTDAATGVIVAANPAACTILGRPEAEIVAKTRNHLVDPADPRLAGMLEQRRRTGRAQGELRMVRGDGSSFEAEVFSVIFAFGESSRAGIVFRDVTERRRTEAQLRKLSSIVEQSPLSVVITDLEGRIEYVNPRFCAVTGYSATEVLGQNPRILKSGETPGEVYREMWSMLRRGETWSGELHNLRKNGEKFIENTVITPVVDEHQRPTHYVAQKEDVTTQRRTIALLEKERQVSEMKTRFISVTSHEFRTPMAAAMGSVELLTNHLDRLTPAKREELLNRISGSLRRMTEMLDEILLLNRMDAKRVEASPGVFDLRALAQNAMEEIRLADHEAHRFELEVAGDTAGFVTDPSLMQHILANLLSNAVRYSPKGSEVTVRIAVDAAGARIEVEDQGIGIPPADLSRLFQPFERGSNAGNIKGTGLGLSIVKRMIELLGGTVGIEVPEGGGTRFVLRHPRLPVPSPQP